MTTERYQSRAHEIRAHDLTRRAERRGDGLRASHQPTKARATDATESPLARLQRQADQTLADYHSVAGTREVAYDEDGNEVEANDETNFGYVENEEER